MEWVEVTGKTVAAAKDVALDRLGVAEDDAEFEIIDEPRTGFLGRLKGEARVRARVRPTQARHKVERRDRKRSKDAKEARDATTDGETDAAPTPTTRAPRRDGTGGSGGGGGARNRSGGRGGVRQNGDTKEPDQVGSIGVDSPQPRVPRGNGQTPSVQSKTSESDSSTQQESIVSAEQVGEEAIRFMDGLVSAFGLTGTSELVEDGDDLEVRVHGDGLGLLVGPRGTTLQAVQDLARVAAQRRLGDHDTRLRVDVGGYRERRKEALGKFAEQMAVEVKDSGVARVLEPMSSADRKVIHDVLSSDDGVATRSEGEDPFRRIVIAPAHG